MIHLRGKKSELGHLHRKAECQRIFIDIHFFLIVPLFFLLHVQDLSKSPKSVKKLLPKRKPERKQSEEEFALRKSKFALNSDEMRFVV